MLIDGKLTQPVYIMRGSRGGGGGSGGAGPPLEFSKLIIADITGNEKNSYFSLPQLYVKVGPPPWKNSLDPRLPEIYRPTANLMKSRQMTANLSEQCTQPMINEMSCVFFYLIHIPYFWWI